MFIQVLEKLPRNYYRDGTVDSQMLACRLQPDDYWIKTLGTVCPSRMNQQAKFMYTNKPIDKSLPSLPRYGERSRDTRKRLVDNENNLYLNLNSFINLLIFFDVKTRTNECRKQIEKLNRNLHRNIDQKVNTRLSENDEKYRRCYETIIDMFCTKTYIT